MSTGVYSDNLDHLLAELDRLDRLLGRRLETWWAERDGVVDEFRGLYVADEEVTALLRSADERGASPAGVGAAGESVDAGRDGEREAGTDAAASRARERRTLRAGTDLRLARLADLVGLDERERDALVVALAPEVDRKYETVYSYLQDDVTERRPTVGFVLELLCANRVDRIEARRLFDRDAPLRANRLLFLEEGSEPVRAPGPLLSRFVRVDERVVDYLLGGDAVDPVVAGAVAAQSLDDVDLPAFLDEATRTRLDRLATADPPPMVYLDGPYGAGKRPTAAALGHRRGSTLVVVDAAKLPEDALDETLERATREALFREATLHVRNADAFAEGVRPAVVRRLDEYPGLVVLSGETEWRPKRPPARHAFAAVSLPVPPYETRVALWRTHLGDADVAGDVDVHALAGKFGLTDGQIRDAVASAASRDEDDAALTPTRIYEACRAQSGGRLASLARKIDPHYRWEDIVLPPDREAQLREVAAHVEHRGTVYGEWGFEEKFSLGNGLVVLFTGPSGTGKTMATDIVAREAGLDLYKIDLSSVVSKYIGETEKNLREIFDEAERSDAILLFDEADAVFGKRSEVRDAHDRYANIEVNYLLQRIEEYDGTVVLTTNYKQNIDDAFTRRIHLSVDFPLPDPESRAAIWRSVFPATTPLGALDVEYLSEFEFTGGNIKNVALTAAFLAADEDSAVEMTHVVRAARREFQKSGRLTSSREFGEYLNAEGE